MSTWDHPVQSFVWDDFTAKPGRQYEYTFYPLKGTPQNLNRQSPPVAITIKTEPLYSDLAHDIFFNRGVASSQAYAKRFSNKQPKELPPAERARALAWLCRDLKDAILRFIDQAKPGDTLLCCFYEFRYQPVADALQTAIDRKVDVRIIVDAKVNESTDDDGVFHPSFPRTENLDVIAKAGLPEECVILREARPRNIQHNKFMVLLEGKKKRPTQVWTGSTNISEGGIFGQTNVGHWLRNDDVAGKYKNYWELLAGDPGTKGGDDPATARNANAAFYEHVEKLHNAPVTPKELTDGVIPVFSLRRGLEVLNLYFKLVGKGKRCSCITLAFGINSALRTMLVPDQRERNRIRVTGEGG